MAALQDITDAPLEFGLPGHPPCVHASLSLFRCMNGGVLAAADIIEPELVGSGKGEDWSDHYAAER